MALKYHSMDNEQARWRSKDLEIWESGDLRSAANDRPKNAPRPNLTRSTIMPAIPVGEFMKQTCRTNTGILIIATALVVSICAASAQQPGVSQASKRGSAYPSGSKRGTAFPKPGAARVPRPPPVAEVPVPSGQLPDCPTWDWSKGAPPPMSPPFDRSKLYCPPSPFHPPNPPIGCVCR